MNKPVRIILLGEAEIEYKKLNAIVGNQIKEGKENLIPSVLSVKRYSCLKYKFCTHKYNICTKTI